ncbi:MAG: hypothetical protein ACI3YE_06320 [Candidatus Avispirillum sp.]
MLMKLASLSSNTKTEKTVSTFSGLDRRSVPREGCFADMLNMSTDSFPALSMRKQRCQLNFGDTEIYGMLSLDVQVGQNIAHDAFVLDVPSRLKAYYADDDGFGEHIIMNTNDFLTQGKKQYVTSGTRLYFFPDKKVVNLMTMAEKLPLEYTKTIPLGAQDGFFYELCAERSDLDGILNSSGAFTAISCSVYKLSSDGGKGTYYEKLAFNSAIKKNDTVELTGFASANLNGFYNIKNIDIERSKLIISPIENFTQSTGSFGISRTVPDMDFVVSAGNRLWGCRYGVGPGNVPVNEIYASALGDAYNWHRFEGVSTDSWTASINTPGAFTGAVCFNGNPVFFKENAIIKVFGSYPAEFTVTESKMRGVEIGSSESIAAVGDCLYYKSTDGIVCYDGSIPQVIDQNLDSAGFRNAVAGSVGGKYYVTMADRDGERSLYVYDSERKLWSREDDPGIVSFCRSGTKLYMLCQNGTESTVYAADSDGITGTTEKENSYDWSFQTGDMGYDTPHHKYVSRVILRFEPEAGASATVSLSRDGGEWVTEYAFNCTGDGIKTVELRPRRCASFCIKVEGRGKCVLRSLTSVWERCSRVSPRGL